MQSICYLYHCFTHSPCSICYLDFFSTCNGPARRGPAPPGQTLRRALLQGRRLQSRAVSRGHLSDPEFSTFLIRDFAFEKPPGTSLMAPKKPLQLFKTSLEEPQEECSSKFRSSGSVFASKEGCQKRRSPFQFSTSYVLHALHCFDSPAQRSRIFSRYCRPATLRRCVCLRRACASPSRAHFRTRFKMGMSLIRLRLGFSSGMYTLRRSATREH